MEMNILWFKSLTPTVSCLCFGGFCRMGWTRKEIRNCKGGGKTNSIRDFDVINLKMYKFST